MLVAGTPGFTGPVAGAAVAVRIVFGIMLVAIVIILIKAMPGMAVPN